MPYGKRSQPAAKGVMAPFNYPAFASRQVAKPLKEARASGLRPPSSSLISALNASALEDEESLASGQWQVRRVELSGLLWAAFTQLSDQDRKFWAHCVWDHHCECSRAREADMSLRKVRMTLRSIARRLDQACDTLLQARREAAGLPGPAAMLTGASRKRLDEVLSRKRLRCVCK